MLAAVAMQVDVGSAGGVLLLGSSLSRSALSASIQSGVSLANSLDLLLESPSIPGYLKTYKTPPVATLVHECSSVPA